VFPPASAPPRWTYTPPSMAVTLYSETTKQEIFLPPAKIPQSVADVPLPCSSYANTTEGKQIYCVMNPVYCNYQVDKGDSATFCYDALYPKQTFTVLILGYDWSGMDGRCVVFSGNFQKIQGSPSLLYDKTSLATYYSCQGVINGTAFPTQSIPKEVFGNPVSCTDQYKTGELVRCTIENHLLPILSGCGGSTNILR